MGWVAIGIIGANIIVNLIVTIVTMSALICVHIIAGILKLKELLQKKVFRK
jgi:hypothetical protein